MGNDYDEVQIMEYSEIYVNRIKSTRIRVMRRIFKGIILLTHKWVIV